MLRPLRIYKSLYAKIVLNKFERKHMSVEKKDLEVNKRSQFFRKLQKATDKKKTPKQIYGIIIGSILGCLVVLLITAGISIYSLKSDSRPVRVIAKVVPFPALTISGNPVTKTVSYHKYLFELDSVKHYFRSIKKDLDSKDSKDELKKVKDDLFLQLEEERVIVDQAKKNNITVSNKEVEDRFNEIVTQSGDIKKVKQTLSDLYGWGVDDFKGKIRFSLTKEKLEKKVASNKDLEEKSRKIAEGLMERAKKGEDFAALAKQYSQDGSASQGGDLGFFERGKMVKEFEDAAFALEVGQISNVIKTEYGFHIIKVTEKKDNSIRASHILIPTQDINSWLSDIKGSYKIKRYI